MLTNNIFTIGLNVDITFSNAIFIDKNTGEITITNTVQNNSCSQLIYLQQLYKAKFLKIKKAFCDNVIGKQGFIYFYDINKKYIGRISVNSFNVNEIYKPDTENNFMYAAFELTNTTLNNTNYKEAVEFNINVIPHYKSLKKQCKKENNQLFFRESLDGKINLFGSDYEIIKNASLENIISFNIYKNNELYITNIFNKTDCKFNHSKCSVELNLMPNDKYTNILNAYNNTYDLIKLAPQITQIEYTKRCVIQIYIQGGKTITNVFGGTYWEDEVNEAIDDADMLTKKYHFGRAENSTLAELSFLDFEGLLKGVEIKCTPGYSVWESTKHNTLFEPTVYIRFIKKYDGGQSYISYIEAKLLSTGSGSAIQINTPSVSGSPTLYYCLYDIYSIQIYYKSYNGSEMLICESESLYGNDSNFILETVGRTYNMKKVANQYNDDVLPKNFYLGEYLITYGIFGRILSAAEMTDDGSPLYDLPYDDFATARTNLKKCIGLRFTESSNSVCRIYQTDLYSDSPTAYGINDYGKYFRPPYLGPAERDFIPIARSTWANTSIWLYLIDLGSDEIFGFEHWCKQFYTKSIIKDAYSLSSVIKAMLAKIDNNIKHEGTSEYSEWLYGTEGTKVLDNTGIFITQKTNILKGGDYDQAAQKAEITFEQLMNMLRDAFKCYWFIDSENRFRIEHISYFLSGMRYSQIKNIQLDLTQKIDKFNKKNVLYGQQEISYKKSELASRFEFNWMDDTTEQFGDIQIDVNSNYVQKDKTESISVEHFTPDLDFMLFVPDKFSSEGFALLLADKNTHSISIKNVQNVFINEKQYNASSPQYVQNWYATWANLIKSYMYDMPAYNINISRIRAGYLFVADIMKCMQHEILYQSSENISLYRLIKTEIGDGYIEEVSFDVDTNLISVILSYKPD